MVIQPTIIGAGRLLGSAVFGGVASAAYVPVLAAAGVSVASGLLARRFVRGAESKAPFRVEDDDVGAFLIGAIGMLVVGLQREAGVWSWFIDLCSFIVAASLVATGRPRGWARRLGGIILGVHAAQVLVTNANAPLRGVWFGAVERGGVEVAVGATYLHLVVAGATVVAASLLARYLVRNATTRAPYRLGVEDVGVAFVGFAGMTIGGLLQEGASVWSYGVDIGAFAIAAALAAVYAPSSWPRRVGLLMLGLHAAQVLVTDLDAPVHGAFLSKVG